MTAGKIIRQNCIEHILSWENQIKYDRASPILEPPDFIGPKEVSNDDKYSNQSSYFTEILQIMETTKQTEQNIAELYIATTYQVESYILEISQ